MIWMTTRKCLTLLMFLCRVMSLILQKESEYRSQSPGQRLQERVQCHEGVSPRLSPAIHCKKNPVSLNNWPTKGASELIVTLLFHQLLVGFKGLWGLSPSTSALTETSFNMCGMCVYFYIQETCTSSSAPQEVCEPTNDLPKFSPDLCNDCDTRLPSEPVSSSRVVWGNKVFV